MPWCMQVDMLDKRVEYDLGGFVFFKTCNPMALAQRIFLCIMICNTTFLYLQQS